MNKGEVVAKMSELSGMTKKDSEKALNSMLEVIEGALVGGDKVQLVGFGTFETKSRAARKGRNPQTKQEIDIPASTVPAFKAGKAFKDAISK